MREQTHSGGTWFCRILKLAREARGSAHAHGGSTAEKTIWPGAGRLMLAVVAACVLAGGCTSHPRLEHPPLSPPAGRGIWLNGADGTQLYAVIDAPMTAARGVVWLVLGPEIRSAEPYPTLRAALAQAGYAWAAMHPRGAGYSDGVRGDIADYEKVLGDFALFHEYLRSRFPGSPCFLVGHSAGGPLALEVAVRTKERLAGMILVNPAYKLIYHQGMGPSFLDYVAYAGNYVFRSSALTVDMNRRPSALLDPDDRAEAEAMQADALVVRYFSLRYMLAQKKVMARTVANVARVTSPLLIVQGARDALVDPRGNDEILAAAATADKRRIIAPAGGHGSSAVETTTQALIEWLLAHAT